MKKCALLLTGIMLIGCVAAGCGNRKETDGAGKETTQAAYELEYETGNMNAEFARKSDGTYVCDEVMADSGKRCFYIVLTNDASITVDKVIKSSEADADTFVVIDKYQE